MDTFLTIASRREVREYAARPIPDDGLERANRKPFDEVVRRV